MTTRQSLYARRLWLLFRWDIAEAIAFLAVMIAAFAALPGIVAVAWAVFGWAP